MLNKGRIANFSKVGVELITDFFKYYFERTPLVDIGKPVEMIDANSI